jgi:hypothetical protein
MSRSEWLTIVVLLGAILAVLIVTAVYQHYIWKDVCAMWQILWKQAFHDDIEKLHLGDSESREHREGPGRVLGSRGPDIPKGIRDAGPRGPFVY